MFLPYIVAALASGFALEILANPVSRRIEAAVQKRYIPTTHDLHERHEPHWSRHWDKKARLPGSKVVPMRIGIKQGNIEAGQAKLLDISNLGSPNYGRHMTADEVVDFFAPAQSTVNAIVEWLTTAGIAAERIGHSANKQWIQFDATVDEVENLLYAEYFIWEHSSGTQDVSTEEYHVPKHIQEHIDYITPGIRLRTRTAQMQSSRDISKRANDVYEDVTLLSGFPHPNSSTCSLYVTAECTRAQYSIPKGTSAFPGNKLGIFEGENDHYSRVDLDVYFSTLYPHIPNGTYPEERLIDGAVGAIEDPSNFTNVEDGAESALDFDSAIPLIFPQGTVLFQQDDQYYESKDNLPGFWNTFLDAIDGSYCNFSAFGETGDCTDPACLDPVYPDPNPGGYKGQLQCGVYKPTNVISISYHTVEGELPDSYLKRQCLEWMKLVLQGTTIVTSSGDVGVGAANQCGGAEGQIFSPHSAASCPYVLAVGSTEWNRFANATGPEEPFEPLDEVATQRFASGGGFSQIFKKPSYQHAAVAGYLNQVESTLNFTGYDHPVIDGNYSSVTEGVFFRSGRGYPDVAAVGDRQVVFTGGQWRLIGGTSLSSPVFASVITLINEARLRAGKSTLGFLHPILYAHPEVFHDVTVGNNPGCNNSPGFPNARGWDPVSGLGSPNFPKLLKLLFNV
ncbi:peptidase S8/S53 domain-containing protein [Xylaria sp. FL0064]|nr:peptidase S8/S53 domain-containing protein [Xylaria sp. FL0064]